MELLVYLKTQEGSFSMTELNKKLSDFTADMNLNLENTELLNLDIEKIYINTKKI